jgi:SAM-dependent methyltransferase
MKEPVPAASRVSTTLSEDAAAKVEAAVGASPSVAECVAIPRDGSLTAFVKLASPAGEQSSEDRETRWKVREQLWATIYDNTYSAGATPADAEFNTAAWVDSYTGQLIAEDEMREFIDATAARVASFAPKRILEIGCSTGLLLFRLAPRCERYVGVDISARALDHVRSVLATMPEHADRVALHQCSALEIDRLEGAPFDLVLIDSVVLHFPSVDYLTEVVRRAASILPPGGVVFLGDLRSLPLLPAFHAEVAVRRAAPGEDAESVQARWRKSLGAEKQLVLDPAFLFALRDQVPAITDAWAIVKRGAARNELTQFRYDVVLVANGSKPAPEGSIAWRDWEKEGMTLDALRAQLATPSTKGPLAVRGIPNARLATSHPALARVQGDAGEGSARDATAGVDPEDLYRAGHDAGWSVHVGWADSSPRGDLAVVFTRGAADDHAFSGVASAPGGGVFPLAHFAHSMMRDRAAESALRALEEAARGVLPQGATVRVCPVARIPRDASGAVDRALLETLA